MTRESQILEKQCMLCHHFDRAVQLLNFRESHAGSILQYLSKIMTTSRPRGTADCNNMITTYAVLHIVVFFPRCSVAH